SRKSSGSRWSISSRDFGDVSASPTTAVSGDTSINSGLPPIRGDAALCGLRGRGQVVVPLLASEPCRGVGDVLEIGPGRLDVFPVRLGLRHEVVVTDLLKRCLVRLLGIALGLLLPPDAPPVGEAVGLTRDRRLRISVGRDGTGRDGYGGVPVAHGGTTGGSPRVVPVGQVWDSALTSELAATISPLLTLPLPLILALSLDLSLHGLVFVPIHELVAGVAVMLIRLPRPGADQLVRVSLGAAPFLDHERGHEAVCEVVGGPCSGDGPEPDRGGASAAGDAEHFPRCGQTVVYLEPAQSSSFPSSWSMSDGVQ